MNGDTPEYTAPAKPKSPFAVGDRVQVVQIVDDADEHNTIGLAGTVADLEYSPAHEYPQDPWVVVNIDGRPFPMGCFVEELKKL